MPTIQHINTGELRSKRRVQTTLNVEPVHPHVNRVHCPPHSPLFDRTLTIWGMSAKQLHDARWSAQGVQCVRSGDADVQVDRSADLYLLLAPDQCVLFDLISMIDRIVWSGADLTRIMLIDTCTHRYEERIVRDRCNPDMVQRIERRYGASSSHNSSGTSQRAILTNRPALAERWLKAASPRKGWINVRHVPGFRGRGRACIDRVRVHGCSLYVQTPADEKRLLNTLVEHWSNPDSVIEGIEETSPGSGVWGLHRNGTPALHSHVSCRLIGPIWLGCGRTLNAGPNCVIVGPAWLGDDPRALNVFQHQHSRVPISIRSFRDIEHEALAPAKDVQSAPQQTTATAAPHSTTRSAFYPPLKRGMDILLSACLLVAAAPIMFVIAIAVMIADGRPIFFRHKRQTMSGRTFDCLKFRTMLQNAEAAANDLENLNICDGPQVFIHNDPRVTRLGQFLRRMHLDELPQLWNVLVGDMSLVGPRPSPDSENRLCPAWRELRLSVRPGITGLWQLRRTRSPGCDFQEWIRYDIEYVHRASLMLDLRLLMETACMLLFNTGKRSLGTRSTKP